MCLEKSPDYPLYAVLDASSPIILTGLYHSIDKRFIVIESSSTEALDSIFEGLRNCLTRMNTEISQLGGFIYCQGPGSILGIRLGIMAINTWCQMTGESHRSQIILSYNSLEMVAQALLAKESSLPFHVISEYKKGHWNLLSVSEAHRFSQIRTISDEELVKLNGTFYHLPHRKPGPMKPGKFITISYNSDLLETGLKNESLLSRAQENGVYSPVPIQYTKWQSIRHR